MDKGIQETLYRNDKNFILSYGSENCKYCKIIKPGFEEYLKDNNYTLVSEITITKEEYKSRPEHKFIPAFIIKNKNSQGCHQEYIQTSDINKLKETFNNFTKPLVLDDNF